MASPRFSSSFLRPTCHLTALAVSVALLSSCGGGGSGSIGGTPIGLPASSTLAEQCAVPRTGADPITGIPFMDTLGSVATEKAFLRSWIDETYLWYQDVRALPAATLDPTGYATALDYFAALKTPLNDAAGQPKDKFHFTYDSIAWEQLSLNGVAYGYGFELAVLRPTFDLSTTPPTPRSVVVAYTDNGALTAQTLGRGAAILTVDGVDVAFGADFAALNAGLFPTGPGTHTLVVQDLGSNTTRTVPVTASAITETPVQNVKTLNIGGAKVGYMLFNDHIATAELELVNAITQLKNSNVTDLVLDIRYNGGGYLDIASELAYMIAGPNVTIAATPPAFFERETFNDRNPFNFTTAQATTPFHDHGQNFNNDVPTSQALPVLGLPRVFVLTTADTCSASEAIINGLRGAGVIVNQIGSTTCGKPYGFFPQDNCGTTYFAIQFQGVNNLGLGDYADGFVPPASCSVADDFSHALGDPSESLLQVALGLRANGACAPPSGQGTHILSANASSTSTPVLVRNPFRENRILRNP
jgi:carboxyl-terminal processing protease